MNTHSTNKSLPKGVVSAVLIQHYLRLSRNFGLPLEQIMQAADITHSDLNPTNGWVTQETLERLSTHFLAMYQDPLVGLRLLNKADPAILGALGYMLQCCPTLLDMFHAITEFGHLVSTVSNASFIHEPGVVLWRVEHQSEDDLFVRQADESYLAACAILVNRQYPQALQAVRLPHEAILENAQPHPVYQQIFKCPVVFNQLHAALVLDPKTLNVPLPFADALMFDSLRQHARIVLNQIGAEPSLVHRVKEKLRHLLVQGISSRDAVAQSLDISSRHLHRQLQAQGCHYQAILSELRNELAHKYLLQTPYDLDDIAVKLGFGSARSFCRWFRAEMGITPIEFRHKSLSH